MKREIRVERRLTTHDRSWNQLGSTLRLKSIGVLCECRRGEGEDADGEDGRHNYDIRELVNRKLMSDKTTICQRKEAKV